MIASVMSDSSDSVGNEWLTMAQAADRLGVSPPTLRRWADQGRIPVRRTLGGHRRVPISELPRIAPLEVPARPRPGEAQPETRGEELPRGRAEVLDDVSLLHAERERLAAELAEARGERDRLREELAEANRAQAELRQVILRLLDGKPPAGR